MKKYLMTLDEGTTGARCIIFDRNGNIRSVAAREFPQYFPTAGYVEHDATEIWQTQLTVAKEALKKAHIGVGEIAGIGITNQRETTIIWDKKTGKPIHHAIVWQCRRTADRCEEIKKDGMERIIKEKTGLAVDPYFSATKIDWLLSNVEGARARAERGELLFGTVEWWLIWNLTGGAVHATDPSNASRTMLYNIHTCEWDEELLRYFHIPAALLPEVRPNAGAFGHTDPALFGAPLPIAGVAGDQQAALFGQCCFSAGSVKNTYGTGGFLLMNTGDTAMTSKNGLLAGIAWQLGDRVTYALEGSVFVCGAAIQWLRDGMGLLASAAESEAVAASVPDTEGVYFVPAFVGLGTPYWDPYARGVITGLSRGTTRAHLVRATLEAMSYQTVDVLDAMQKDTGLAISSLRVDGGAVANNLLLEIQSDLAGLSIERPTCIETTAWGAAALAGLSVGFFKDLDEIAALTKIDRVFTPHMSNAEREIRLSGWHRAIRAAQCK